MSVTSSDFSGLPLQDEEQAESDNRRESVAPLPALTPEQIEGLDRLMARGDLPQRQDEGPGAARMLGAVALAGLAMVAGAAYALWRHLAPAMGL